MKRFCSKCAGWGRSNLPVLGSTAAICVWATGVVKIPRLEAIVIVYGLLILQALLDIKQTMKGDKV
jgi:hypothetical protein